MRTTKLPKISVSVALALGVTFAAGACSSEPSSSPAENPTANVVQSNDAAQSDAQAEEEVDGPTQAELLAYFEALTSGNPSAISEAVEMAAPGSNAQAYAIYRRGTAQADLDGGFTNQPSKVTAIEGGFKSCDDGASSGDSCFEFTNIQHDGEQIADFDAGGTPLAGRLSLGNGEIQPLGEAGSASMLAAFKASSGAVVAVFEVSAAVDGMWVTATYTAPDGRQSQSTLMSGPTDLGAGAFANYSYVFEGADFGGQVHLEAIDGNGYDAGSATFATQ